MPDHKPWWDRTLPPADHPLWRIAHGVIGIAGIGLVAMLGFHGFGGEHAGGVDLTEAGGVAGVGMIAVAVRQFFR